MAEAAVELIMARREQDLERRKAAADRAHFGWWLWLASLAPVDPPDRAPGKRSG